MRPRAYFDVAFFHTYDDANARLAGLVLQLVLLRGSIDLDEVAPIHTVHSGGDAGSAADLASRSTAPLQPPIAGGCGRTTRQSPSCRLGLGCALE